MAKAKDYVVGVKKGERTGDHIPFGSQSHADLLGIRKADEDDTINDRGWALVDGTQFGPQATERYIKEVLRQQVDVLEAGPPPKTQSKTPWKPHYAPTMFDPDAVRV